MDLQEDNMKKYKVGYVPGVYDLFHIGHLNLIQNCKKYCEYLIVGVLSDELVEFYKGKRPFIPFAERIAIIDALRDVDETVRVDSSNTDKMDAWKQLKYDVHFSGDDHLHDWKEEKIKLQELGATIEFLPYTKSTSSTQIRDLIEKALV